MTHPILCAIGLAAAGAAQAQPVWSRFDTDAEGWTFYNDGTAFAWRADVGDPPGSIFCRDRASGQWWGFTAGPRFRDDKSTAYGRAIVFTVHPSAVNTADDSIADVTITGAGRSLVIDLAMPAANTWNRYEVILNPEAGWRIGSFTGAVPTEQEFRQTLAAITDLRVRGEFKSGADHAFLDNAGLGVEPCYANCDRADGRLILDIFDFLCFQNAFAVLDPYACECDTGTGVGVCDIFDFLCFQNAFAAGCP